ncbi:MAG: metallophosphoesterase [Candidatus Micrarchaeia archaeon]
MRFVTNQPALVHRGILVIADLQLGIEEELRDKEGIRLASRTPELLERVKKLVRRVRPRKLILLGDVKHSISSPFHQEWVEVPWFIRRLQEIVPVEIVPGNHDGDLRRIVQSVPIHPVSGVVMGDLALCHGHAWPAPELLRARYLAMGHNHPGVRFVDSMGHAETQKAWVIGELDVEKAREKYGDVNPELKIIVMPAFNELVASVPFNAISSAKELLGPLFEKQLFKLDSSKLYLLNGVRLGSVATLRGEKSGF